ncbi:MAG: hypothetical protein NUV42_00805 [Candidatus Yonathbacteria bacterium]|nr:hypothetical protein [Candidatus Yonathbacteria bacterium]
MNVSLSQSLTKFLLMCGIITFLLVGFFGVGLMGIHMGSPEQEMPGCPVMGITTLCQMNPLEHITAWQSMFVSVSPKGVLGTLAFFLAFLFLTFSVKSFWSTRRPLLLSDQKTISIPRVVISIIRNPLAEAFSNGILNPKIF